MQTGLDKAHFAATSAFRVDVALVLAVDCSSSVDAGDFRMQMDGIAAALRNPPFAGAIAAGPHGRIALSLVQWSSRRRQAITMNWRLLTGRPALEMAARDIEKAERNWDPGGTGIAAAIEFSIGHLQNFAFLADRRVIDVSGDGEESEGGDAATARDRAKGRGITINGLPIISGSNRLESYYRRNVVGGPGAFVIPAKDMRSFGDAMARKLLREVASATA